MTENPGFNSPARAISEGSGAMTKHQLEFFRELESLLDKYNACLVPIRSHSACPERASIWAEVPETESLSSENEGEVITSTDYGFTTLGHGNLSSFASETSHSFCFKPAEEEERESSWAETMAKQKEERRRMRIEEIKEAFVEMIGGPEGREDGVTDLIKESIISLKNSPYPGSRSLICGIDR